MTDESREDEYAPNYKGVWFCVGQIIVMLVILVAVWLLR